MRLPPATILAKLLLAYVAPTLILFTVFASLAYDLLRRDLDVELGLRLSAVAAATAAHIRGGYLVDMDASEKPTPAAWSFTRRELDAARAATGVERLYVFTPERTSLCDTRDGVPIGAKMNELELDRHELTRVFAGTPTSSVLFQGAGGALYKAGYAPVVRSERDRTVVAALRVEAPAAYFTELSVLATRLITSGAVLAAVVVLASFVVAARLTRPIRRLAADAARIGRGELEAPVALGGGRRGHDELAVLGRTLDEMRAALRARDERLQMMLAGIAHEVRNPLGGIELFTGILREELSGEPLEHVRRIEKELGHLKSVVGDFLDYARRPPPDLGAVDLAALAAEVHELLGADAGAAGVTLALEATPVVAAADAKQLRRALVNLVRNGIQATPAGGTVTTVVDEDGGRARIAVRDTGAGIAAERLPRVFDAFYTTKEKGTGLGLAFVREIVSDHGGRLDIDSAVGRGTRVVLELPLGGS